MTRSTYHIPYCLILFLMSCQGCCYAQDIILGASAGVAIPTTNTDVQSPGFDWCVEANFRLKKTRVYLHGAFEQTSIYSTGTTKLTDKYLQQGNRVRFGVLIVLAADDQKVKPYVRPSILLDVVKGGIGGFLISPGLGVDVLFYKAASVFVDVSPMISPFSMEIPFVTARAGLAWHLPTALAPVY